MSAFGLNRYAQAFAVAVNAAGTRISDKPISCVDRLVTDLWNYAGPLEKAWRFFYPFVGGTAVSNSFNLANPAFGRIVWSGNVTHNSNGITGDGSSGFGSTGVTLAGGAITDSYVLFGHYCRTANTGSYSDFGNYTGATPGLLIQTRWGDGITYFYTGAGIGVALPNSQGLFSAIRVLSTSMYGYRNGTYVTTTTSGPTSSAIDPTFAMMILARRGSTTDPSVMIEYSNRTLAIAFLGNKYADYPVFGDQQTFYNNVIQPFQTRLGRSV